LAQSDRFFEADDDDDDDDDDVVVQSLENNNISTSKNLLWSDCFFKEFLKGKSISRSIPFD
jgi:hypothetical protein